MKNTYKQRTYQCKCGELIKEYVWDSDLTKTKVKCSECNKILNNKNLLNETTKEVIGIRTPTKNR